MAGKLSQIPDARLPLSGQELFEVSQDVGLLSLQTRRARAIDIAGIVASGTFIASGAGAVLRTMVGKARDVVSVRDFGAVGDGVTDDAPAINAAIQSLPITGGVVVFPPGGYWKLGSSITMNRSAVTLIGAGVGNSSAIVNSNSTFPLIDVTAADCSIRDLSLAAGFASGTSYAIDSSNAATGLFIENVSVNGTYHGIRIRCLRGHVHRADVKEIATTHGIGIMVDHSGLPDGVCEITSCTVENNGALRGRSGLELQNAIGVQASNCDFMQMNYACILANNSFSCNFNNCFFDTSGTDGVLITGSVVRSRFSNCWFSSAAGRGLNVTGAVCRGLILNTCEFYDNALVGIDFGAGTYDGTIVSSCLFSGNLTDINVANDVNHFTIQGCRTGAIGGFAASATGLYINATNNWYVVTGNRLHNFTDSGGGANKVVANNLT